MGFFQDLFGSSSAKAAQEAAAARQAGLERGYKQATGLYEQGRGELETGYGGAMGTYQPIYDIGLGGAGAYADITGAAGPGGQARARQVFMSSPGYQFALDEALRATERQRGSGGFQGSGNVLAALTDRASGLAQQDFGNYVQRLAPFLGYSLGGGQLLGGAYTGLGQDLATSLSNQGNLAYNTQAGIGNAQASGILGAAAARSAAAGNIANLGTKLLGFALGGGPGGGSLFNTPLTNPNMAWT